MLSKATAINPGYAFAYYVKSLALIFTKQFPEAIEAAQELSLSIQMRRTRISRWAKRKSI